MPPVVRPLTGVGSVAYQFNQLRARITAQGTQQQGTITNLEGLPVINTGAVPGTTPQEYGIQVVDPATQEPFSFYGLDGSGNPVLQFFDGNGNLLSQFDATGAHFYNTSGQQVTEINQTGVEVYDTSGHLVTELDNTGLHSYNSSGVEETTIGLIPSTSIYGAAVKNPTTGVFQMLSGIVTAAGSSVSGATNTSWAAFSGGSVTVSVGPSGQAAVSYSAGIATSGTSVEGIVGVFVDGAGSPANTIVTSAGVATNGVPAAQFVLSGLSVGTHSLALGYEVANPGSVNFTFPVMVVQPL